MNEALSRTATIILGILDFLASLLLDAHNPLSKGIPRLVALSLAVLGGLAFLVRDGFAMVIPTAIFIAIFACLKWLDD